MPYPKRGETEDEFVHRYMGSEEAQRSFPQQDQRLKVAYSLFKRRNKKSRKALEDLGMKFVGDIEALDAPVGPVKLDKGRMSAEAVFCTTTRDRGGDVFEVGGILTDARILAVFSARDGLGFDLFDRALTARLRGLLSNRYRSDRHQQGRYRAATSERDESAHQGSPQFWFVAAAETERCSRPPTKRRPAAYCLHSYSG